MTNSLFVAVIIRVVWREGLRVALPPISVIQVCLAGQRWLQMRLFILCRKITDISNNIKSYYLKYKVL